MCTHIRLYRRVNIYHYLDAKFNTVENGYFVIVVTNNIVILYRDQFTLSAYKTTTIIKIIIIISGVANLKNQTMSHRPVPPPIDFIFITILFLYL